MAITLAEARENNPVLRDPEEVKGEHAGLGVKEVLAGMDEVEMALINKAVELMKKNPSLNSASAVTRKAWANGFYNGFQFMKSVLEGNTASLIEYLNEEFNDTKDDSTRAQVEAVKLINEIIAKAHR